VLGEVINGPYKPAPPPPTFPTSPAPFPGGAPSYDNTNWPASHVLTLPVGAIFSSSPFPQTTGISPATSTPCMDTSCNGTAANPYEINSIKMSGGCSSCKPPTTPVLQLVGSNNPAAPIYYDISSLDEETGQIQVSGYVVLNIQSTLAISGLGISNGIQTDIPPEYLTMNYAGTSDVNISGNGQISAVLNAPNATVNLKGSGVGGYFVGAIQANNVTDQGGYPVHYDLQLSRMGGTMGADITTAYSRQKM
jgi:hypothetical protein